MWSWLVLEWYGDERWGRERAILFFLSGEDGKGEGANGNLRAIWVPYLMPPRNYYTQISEFT